MSQKSLLFLDVDGVLHPLRLEFKDGKIIDDHCFQPACMQQLKRVVEATGAEIVLSSSWRAYEGPRLKLLQALQPYGLTFTRWTTTLDLDGTRGSQILHFVSQNAAQVGEWAVVDDEPLLRAAAPGSLMEGVVAARAVKTDGAVGMTAADADALIAILTGAGDAGAGEDE
uniref:FCP1 homology domain-containing protein n=1 Tax=Chlamydomonas leiostraca TaxID=1034604 RepID=A0A7S0RZJ5_9CHLO|mmetsp:Transcript_35191/g.89076  ORF Transcript_35191/g.89076 Transcript_35191/m.89076 type:complete len:170 (+) Transcript_35191:58-567(+)